MPLHKWLVLYTLNDYKCSNNEIEKDAWSQFLWATHGRLPCYCRIIISSFEGFFLFPYSKYAKWIVNHNNKNSRLHIDRTEEFCTLWFSESNFVRGSFHIVWVPCLSLSLLFIHFFHPLMTSRQCFESRQCSATFSSSSSRFFPPCISIKKLTYLPDAEKKKAERKRDIKNAMLTRWR